MKVFYILISLIIFNEEIFSLSNKIHFHAEFDSLLKLNVVNNGNLNYSRIQQNPIHLKTYIKKLSLYSPTSHPKLFPTKMHSKSYWINAYNATMINFVVRHYPIKSILDIDNLDVIFKKNNALYGGETLSLDDIEKTKLLKQFKDSKIHYALTCASLSCPPITKTAYTFLNIEQKLNRAERLFLSDPNNLYLKEDTLYLSKIFDWYSEDFIRLYSPHKQYNKNLNLSTNLFIFQFPELIPKLDHAKKARIKYIDYSWLLNDAKSLENLN